MAYCPKKMKKTKTSQIYKTLASPVLQKNTHFPKKSVL